MNYNEFEASRVKPFALSNYEYGKFIWLTVKVLATMEVLRMTWHMPISLLLVAFATVFFINECNKI